MNSHPSVLSIAIPNQMNNEDLDALLEELKCPICTEYMLPPIKQCKRGHCMCDECDSKPLSVCPACPAWNVDRSRRFALERLAGKLAQHIPCRNKGRGCDFIAANTRALIQHKTACRLNELKCVFESELGCEWRGLADALRDHCLEAHEERTSMVPEWNLSFYNLLSRRYWGRPNNFYPFVFFVYDQVFKYIRNFNPEKGIWRWCVLHISSNAKIREISQMYKFKITFFENNDWTGEKMSLCGPCPSVSFLKMDDIFAEGYYLVTNLRYLRDFCKCTVNTCRLNIIKPDDKE